MGVNHFSIKNGLEFMAFIVDHKETYCKSVEFALLFDDYRQANSNWVTAEMREKFLAYIEEELHSLRRGDEGQEVSVLDIRQRHQAVCL